jgi:hypothetical protein
VLPPHTRQISLEGKREREEPHAKRGSKFQAFGFFVFRHKPSPKPLFLKAAVV